MYVTRVPNRGSRPTILLRESYREAGKVRNRTLANLTRWPPERIRALERALKGEPAGVDPGALEVIRTLPHGHVAAILGLLRRLGLEELIDPESSRRRALAVALVVARVAEPSSKLATARGLAPETATSTLGEVLGVSSADEDDLYAAMDWLLERQGRIEEALARRHLRAGTLALYDVSSAAFEGRTCPLGRLGYPRDGVKGRLQIVYGLLTTAEGCPVATEVFEGDTGDPATLARQVGKLKERFGLDHVVFVGDRGMLTKARLEEDLKGAGLDWVTALWAPTIKALVAEGTIQPSLLDETHLGEVSSPEFPGERLVVCRNPLLAAERGRKREDLLSVTEAELEKVRLAILRERRPLRGADKIAVRVGRVLGRYKVAKHFTIEIGDESLTFRRDEEKIAQEAALDGIYVLRTSVPADRLPAPEVVLSYKRLARIERAFRAYNSDLDLRPIHHRRADRVRAHLLVCMLAHYVECHMAADLAPLLFADPEREAAEALRPTPVHPAARSEAARREARRKRTDAGEPVPSLRSLLADLRTIALARFQARGVDAPPFEVLTTPTPLQRRAFELLGVSHRLGFAESGSPTYPSILPAHGTVADRI